MAQSKVKPKTTIVPKQNALMTWLLPIGVLLFTVVVGFLIVKPWWEDTQTKRNESADLKSKITNMVDKINTLSQQDKALLESYSVDLEIAVPAKAHPPKIMATIENEVVKANTSLKNIQFSGVSSEATTTGDENNAGQSILVQVSLQGEVFQIANLLKNLQEVKPLLKIMGVTIASGVASGDDESQGISGSKTVGFSIEAPFKELPSTIASESTVINEVTDSERDLIDQIIGYVSLYQSGGGPVGDLYQSGRPNPF